MNFFTPEKELFWYVPLHTDFGDSEYYEGWEKSIRQILIFSQLVMRKWLPDRDDEEYLTDRESKINQLFLYILEKSFHNEMQHAFKTSFVAKIIKDDDEFGYLKKASQLSLSLEKSYELALPFFYLIGELICAVEDEKEQKERGLTSMAEILEYTGVLAAACGAGFEQLLLPSEHDFQKMANSFVARNASKSRHVTKQPARDYALKRWNEGKFQSRHHASHIIAEELLSRPEGKAMSPFNLQRSVYSWLRGKKS